MLRCEPKEVVEFEIADRRDRGGGTDFGGGYSEALGIEVTVEQAMGANDWLICRRVCGENFSIAETVQAISPGYRFRPWRGFGRR